MFCRQNFVYAIDCALNVCVRERDRNNVDGSSTNGKDFELNAKH